MTVTFNQSSSGGTEKLSGEMPPPPLIHEFSMENSYMFYFKYGPETIVAQPTSIHGDEILFHFLRGHKSEAEFVKKEEIVAVGDVKNGTVGILGWSGRYRILNQELFDKYVKEKVIELKT